jgi:hypothetical protein
VAVALHAATLKVLLTHHRVSWQLRRWNERRRRQIQLSLCLILTHMQHLLLHHLLLKIKLLLHLHELEMLAGQAVRCLLSELLAHHWLHHLLLALIVE